MESEQKEIDNKVRVETLEVVARWCEEAIASFKPDDPAYGLLEVNRKVNLALHELKKSS